MPSIAQRDWVIRGVVGTILTALAWLYLSGYVFLWTIGDRPYSATPLTIARYAYYYRDIPRVRRRLILSDAAGGVLVLGVFAIVFWPRRQSMHGDARFATTAEIASAGLFSNDGILLGRYRGRYLSLPGQQGVLVVAPPRSGKGVGIVVPNLLNFPGSVLCLDVKRENWQLTAGYRAECGQSVYLLDFFSESGRTHRWNPLDYVSENPLLIVNGLQRVAMTLWPDIPGTDPFWSAAAQTMFVGVSLYVFETPGRPRTIGEILRQGMVTGAEGFGAHWRRVIEEREMSDIPLSPACVQALADLVDLAGATASGIRKTFTSRLDLWMNPILDAATSASDFHFRDLRRKPISIYVCVKPADIGRLRRVLNLFFEQAIGEQTKELPEHTPDLKHQLLLALDEFTAIGKLPILRDAMGYLAGFNIRLMIIIQTFSQLAELYGIHGERTIRRTNAALVVHAPKEQDDAEAISAALGMRTVKVKSRSRSAWGSGKGPSTNESEKGRPLMLPQEVKEMGIDKELVFYENLRPVKANKIRYYLDPLLKSRIRKPPEVPMILDPSKPPAPRKKPVETGAIARAIERIESRQKRRKGPVRPKQKRAPNKLAAMNPPTDAAAVDASVAAYIANLTASDNNPSSGPQPEK